jgi:hypothetical protein
VIEEESQTKALEIKEEVGSKILRFDLKVKIILC